MKVFCCVISLRLAKGPTKRLNLSATIGIDISWTKMMFEYCPRIQIYALRPPLLVYAF